jgi:cytoskeletal protein RodZ
MIAIGNTLRDARRRHGLELPQCELETRIRARYLAALEDERFDLLPEPAYARGFLRSYANFLGLDARVLVEELDDRMGMVSTVDEPPIARTPPPRRRSSLPRARQRRRSRMRRKGAIAWLVAGVLGALLVALWVGAAWNVRPSALEVPTTTPPVHTTPTALTPTTTSQVPAGPALTTPQVSLVGSPSTGSHVTVRAAKSTGKVLFSGVIAPGAMRQFSTTGGIWMSFDASTGVQLFVSGRPVEIPGGISRLVISATGVVGPG